MLVEQYTIINGIFYNEEYASIKICNQTRVCTCDLFSGEKIINFSHAIGTVLIYLRFVTFYLLTVAQSPLSACSKKVFSMEDSGLSKGSSPTSPEITSFTSSIKFCIDSVVFIVHWTLKSTVKMFPKPGIRKSKYL